LPHPVLNGAAAGIAGLRREALFGETVAEIEDDRDRFGEKLAVMLDRRNPLVGMRVGGVALALSGHRAKDRHRMDRIGLAEFFEQADDARRAALRRVIESDHRKSPLKMATGLAVRRAASVGQAC
jgi:hypothetical protein